MQKILLNGFEFPVKNRRGDPIRVGRGGSCLQTVESLDVLNNSVKKHENTVLFVRSEKCPHCHQTLPLMEAKCQEAKQSKADVKFLDCPTHLPHCGKILDKVKSQGVPTTVMVKKNKTVRSPEWKVIGADLDNLEKRFKKLGLQGKAPPPQQPQPQQPQPTGVKFGIPEPTQNLLGSIFQPSDGLFPPIKIQNKGFCIPAYDKNCTPDKFSQDLTNILTF